MKGLIRQLKLHALVGAKGSSAPDTDPRVGLIVDFFDELFDGLVIEIIPAYHEERVIFHKGGKFYMEQDLESRWLWCRYDEYWSFLEKVIGFVYKDTQVIIHHMVEKHIKNRVGTPVHYAKVSIKEVEKHIKQEVGIPCQLPKGSSNMVEKYLTNRVGTPITNEVLSWSEVETHIKQSA